MVQNGTECQSVDNILNGNEDDELDDEDYAPPSPPVREPRPPIRVYGTDGEEIIEELPIV